MVSESCIISTARAEGMQEPSGGPGKLASEATDKVNSLRDDLTNAQEDSKRLSTKNACLANELARAK